MNTRDGVGLLIDTLSYGAVYGAAFDFDNKTAAAGAFYATSAISTRKQTRFRYFQSGSPFEYDLVRYLYTQKRKLQIAK